MLHLADASCGSIRDASLPAPSWLPTRLNGSGRPLWSAGSQRLTTLADSMRGSTNRRARIARSLDTRVGRLEATRTVVDKRERTTRFSLPAPRRSGATPLAAPVWVSPTAPHPC